MKSLKQTLNESFNQVNESLSYDEMMDILDIAAQYSSDAHDAANIVWPNKKSLIDYLASDKIERADRKEFLQQVS